MRQPGGSLDGPCPHCVIGKRDLPAEARQLLSREAVQAWARWSASLAALAADVRLGLG